jgi:hypothetical protein
MVGWRVPEFTHGFLWGWCGPIFSFLCRVFSTFVCLFVLHVLVFCPSSIKWRLKIICSSIHINIPFGRISLIVDGEKNKGIWAYHCCYLNKDNNKIPELRTSWFSVLHQLNDDWLSLWYIQTFLAIGRINNINPVFKSSKSLFL